MKVTDIISITELSREIGKSRPTVYKYIADYEAGIYNAVPEVLKRLFERIEKENISKKEVFEYLQTYYLNEDLNNSPVEEVINLIRTNKDKIDIAKLKESIKKEIEENEK